MSLQVQSFHINVGAGDGAIHLLTRPWEADDATTYNAPNNRLFIVQAFLVDGGRSEAADLIETLVSRIEAGFNSAVMRNTNTCHLKFNGIVITHWDGDHYEGVEAYLDSQWGTHKYGPNKSMRKSCISRALYNDDTGAPLTFIYSPWAWPNKGIFKVDSTNKNYLCKGTKRGLFHVRAGPMELMGRNLFRQRAETDNPVKFPSMVKNFEDLVKTNKVEDPDSLTGTLGALPALYCIAAGRRMLGNSNVMLTPTNMSSIILIIAWKVSDTGDAEEDHRISHYLAGDAHTALERGAYNWIGRSITSMKLSHHGAATSNPRDALYTYNPKTIVVSAGAQYGHPRWEVLSNMALWHQEKTQRGYQGPKPLYFCRWPYYLVKNRFGHFVRSRIGIGELSNTAKAKEKEAKDSIQAAKDALKVVSKSSKIISKSNRVRQKKEYRGILGIKVLPFFQKILTAKGKLDKKKLFEVLTDLLPKLSAMEAGGVYAKSVGTLPAEHMDTFLCVHILCDPDEAEDGKVWMLGSKDGVERISNDYLTNSNSVLLKMTQDVPNDCSIALRAAKSKDRKAIAWDTDGNDDGDTDDDDDGDGGEDDDWYVDMYPNKGFDQPMVIDLADGNPDWDSFRKKYDSRGKQHDDDEESDEERANECDAWVDLDESSSLASFGSRRASSCTTFSEVGSALATPRVNPRVQLQEISNEFRALAAKVYLTCQDEASPERAIKIPEGSVPCVLDPGHALAGFLNTLHFHSIGLADIPDTVKSTPVDSNDEIYQWLAMFCGWDPESTSVLAGFAMGMRRVPQWPLKDSMLKTTPLDFEMTVPFTSTLNLKFSTDDGAKLTFSKIYGTDPDPASKTQADESRGVTPEALKQMLEYRRMLVFGLEELKDPVKVTLKDLATFMKIDILNNPLVKILTDGIDLILDTKKDFHNAIWFRPSLAYETHMRLQFHVETSKFNEWLRPLSDSLKVDALWVIGRKMATWMWSNPKDQIVFESSLTFLCLMSISPTRQLEGIFKLDGNSVKLTLTLSAKTIKEHSAFMKTMGASGLLGELMDWLSTTFGVSNKEEFNNVIKQATASETGVMDDNSIIPRRVEVTLGLDSKGNIASVRGVSVDIEACLTIGRPAVAIAEEMPAVFLFTFAWSKGLGFHLAGKLWTVIPDTPFTPYDRALPEFEECEYLKPVSPVLPENQLRTIDIARLLSDKKGEVKNLPAGIPNEIYVCEIFLSQDKVAFKGALRCSQPLAGSPNNGTSPPPMPPTISLENVALQASYTWGTKSPSEKGFEMSLAISIALYLGEYDEYESMDAQNAAAAKLTGRVTYDKGDWTIKASVYDLSILHLLQLWDLDDRGPISEFLGKINIDFVTVAYEFKNGKTSTGAYIDDGKDVRSPSRLAIEGRFTIANVVSLGFEYINSGGDGWTLTAGLGPSEKTEDTATVGGLLSGFMDELVVNSLPEAIRGAKIPGGSDIADKKALQLLMAKKKGTSVFALLVNIGAVSVWFIQIRRGPNEPVKRILKAAISKVSVDVPAFQTTINSPWEDLFFMWVQDQTAPKEGADALLGITQTEYDHMAELLKDKLGVKEEQLHLFKPAAKKEPEPQAQRQLQRFITAAGDEKGDDKDPEASKVVIPAGYHLVIVAKKPDGKAGVILDYLFGTKKKPASSQTYETYDALTPPEKQPKKEPDATGSEKGTKAPFKAKLGPLSVGNVGLWFREGMIGITLDASLIMGPLGFSLLGFSIGVPFGKGYSLANPPPLSAVEWGLKGLILAMDKPPLTIAGGFMRDTSDPKVEVMYTGGIIVGFKPWSFEATGAYATVKKDKDASGKWITTINTRPLHQFTLESITNDSDEAHDGQLVKAKGSADTFTFSFIYVKLNGPLFSVGFADIAGVVGGFGINSDISLPTVEQVTSFPFVAERDSSEKVSPVEKIQSLMDGSWFRPAEGMYWAAAGARVTAFQMLAANIVLVLQFGNGNLLFGIFGVATCDVPALEAPVKFAHVELGIVCTFDVASGIFKFEAQLSPRSFVLAPQCHLTGGMALFSWTKSDRSDKDSENWISAGDWVLTIGGYHRAFKPPKQYPKPPRLGISWSLSSCLSVKGEAYFAITPKVCMGGGKIRAALSLGPLYAWFDAFMDFLMNFEPFFFQMSARVSVGVRFTLDLWLVTIRISVEISAGLDLTGPPFGGVVHVDFWVFGFDIKFGSSPPPPPAVSLDRFWSVATKTKSSSTSSQGLLSAPSPQPDTAAILLTCETGLLPPAQAPKTKSAADSNPQDSKWYVKGGNFALLATFQCPVTEAKLKETRIQTTAAGETEESRDAECTILDEYKKVYAKPMQLYTPLTSAVNIAVKAPRPKMTMQDVHTLESWEKQKWKLTAQTKPVETSIWGQYNMNEDPTRVKGPIGGLLDGNNATMQLVTGISIVPPDPAMAADKINKFNVTKDHMETVFQPGQKEWPLFIDVLKDQDQAWAPQERGTKWCEVKKAWAKVGDDTTSKAVDLWTKRMRYDKQSFDADQKDESLRKSFKPLRGVSPKKLVDKFELLVPALPLIAVG